MENRNSRPVLFLTELIIAILIFALSMGICGALFARSFAASTESTNLNNAVFQAESAAEAFHSYDELSVLAERLGGAASGNNAINVYYDKAWAPIEAIEDARFIMSMSISENGVVAKADISVYGNAGLITELNTSKNTLLKTGKAGVNNSIGGAGGAGSVNNSGGADGGAGAESGGGAR
ncbi:MAG: hypothetical protein LBL49_00960 [Clostridiales Family XIII bacterium]|jgi:uncharacterized membrane protein YgcG|nr:hypothetical protein [Clostridiales Family XIII bacterium]